jgi:hypothetical protein
MGRRGSYEGLPRVSSSKKLISRLDCTETGHIPIIPFYKRGCQDKCHACDGKTQGICRDWISYLRELLASFKMNLFHAVSRRPHHSRSADPDQNDKVGIPTDSD